MSQEESAEHFKYAVVKFDKGAVSVIPTNWYNQELQTCLWPNKGRNSRTHIIKRSAPKDDWENHKILQVYGTYVLYQDALDAERQWGKSSDEDSTSEDNIRTGKRKIIRKIIPDSYTVPILEEEEEEEEEEEQEVNASSSFSVDGDDFNAETGVDCREMKNSFVTRPEIHPTPESGALDSITLADVMGSTQDAGMTVDLDNKVQFEVNEVQHAMSKATTVIESFTAIPDEKYQALLDLVLENRAMLQMILRKINAIDIADLVTPPNVDKLNDKFPIKTIDQLLKIEEELGEDLDFKKQLSNRLSKIGGADFKSHIRRGLSYLMTNQLGTQCSLTGQKNNFRVKDLKLMELLREVISTVFPRSSDKDIETIVGDWLRFSKMRLSRENSSK